jgi:hypothetical protein
MSPKACEPIWKRDTGTPTFIAPLFTIARQLRCPTTDEWMKKKKKIYIYIYHTHTYTPWADTQP